MDSKQLKSILLLYGYDLSFVKLSENCTLFYNEEHYLRFCPESDGDLRIEEITEDTFKNWISSIDKMWLDHEGVDSLDPLIEVPMYNVRMLNMNHNNLKNLKDFLKLKIFNLEELHIRYNNFGNDNPFELRREFPNIINIFI